MKIELDLTPTPNPEPLEPHGVDELGPLHDSSTPATGLDIMASAAVAAGVSVAELIGKDRHEPIARPRLVAMWLIRRDLRWSFPHLGRVFGNRDHTTAMAACRRVDCLRNKGDATTLRLIETIERRAPGLASCASEGLRLVRTA